MDPNTIIGGISAVAAVCSLALQICDGRRKKCDDDADRADTPQDPEASTDAHPEPSADDE
ncbi:hypothetical protein [Streptomyces californicus]|uniref:hypothetical protein n=1 Tax=Streptomyces californicus TaxID=67351 RepID=UPI003647EB7F